MDGWNTSFLLGWPIFRGKLLVLGRVYSFGGLDTSPLVFWFDNGLKDLFCFSSHYGWSTYHPVRYISVIHIRFLNKGLLQKVISLYKGYLHMVYKVTKALLSKAF